MTELESRLRAMLTPNADGLLPCEKCGNSNETTLGVSRWGVSAHEVTCCCGVRGRTRYGADSREQAIASWNRRPALRALVEAMRQRSHGYRYVWDVLSDRQKAEIGQWFERDDAKILALLDGKGET